ncbi:hypothetical protein [Alkalimarinus alittae]|uniref:Uncharacterized protein n=1 Tax=Alkalimarinus alittae TaxID=2961619 RepID=A0ABY6N476_9ALTE|nr:hypothetical protein [Alkalimarinus alittae]UZE96928.1 hypothetical protein NKI27_04030 [Alkalimarinus alittae]
MLIKVPDTDYSALSDYKEALELISELSYNRKSKSYAKLTSWCMIIEGVDDEKTGQDKFVGQTIKSNQEIDLKEGAVIAQCDNLCINARFYMRDRRACAPRSTIYLNLYQVREGELKCVYCDESRAFKTWDKRLAKAIKGLESITWPAVNGQIKEHSCSDETIDESEAAKMCC